MWFKNLIAYRLEGDFTYSQETLEAKLSAEAFVPCSNRDTSRYGWTSPLGKHSEQLCHSANGQFLICAKKQEKLLPAAAIRELVDERAAEIEAKEDRKVFRKEREALKEEVIFESLPRAFTRSSLTFAFIDPKGGWLVVDAASAKKAEELTSQLRESLGSLPLSMLQTAQGPATVMSRWLRAESVPTNLRFLDEAELKAPGEDGAVVKTKRLDVLGEEINQHLDNEMLVSKLAIEWQERVSFILAEDLSIKRLKFSDDLIQEAQDAGSEDPAAKLDADFALMSATLGELLPEIIEWFGGDKPESI